MLNKLKNEIEAFGFSSYKNVEIVHDELFISADSFTGYELFEEMQSIIELIDLKIYKVEYLNDNIIKVKLI